jgi:WD40 repeat protein
MVSTISKWRNVFGEIDKSGSFDDMTIRDSQIDGSMIDVSTEFLAVSWKSNGGCVAIFQAQKFERALPDIPLIRGHDSPVQDVQFSPFQADLLATAGGDDAVVKLWQIPEGGLKQDMTAEIQKFSEHSRKVYLLNFHSSVKEIIASAGLDQIVYVWDITSANTIAKIKLEDNPHSLQWNQLGNLIGTSTRNHYNNIHDPRLSENQTTMKTKSHDNFKASKMGFMDENFIYSSGYNKTGNREVKIFDMRKFEEAADTYRLDTQTGFINPYYDVDSKLLFLPGRGEGNLAFVDLNDHQIRSGNNYTSSTPQKSVAFFPKRAMDYNKSEIARCAKLSLTQVEYLSFQFPRRNLGFNAEFYPDCLNGKPGLGMEEWLKGETKGAERQKITEIENKFKSEIIAFEKKVEVVKLCDLSKEEIIKQNEALLKKVEDLQNQVDELTIKLNESKD